MSASAACRSRSPMARRAASPSSELLDAIHGSAHADCQRHARVAGGARVGLAAHRAVVGFCNAWTQVVNAGTDLRCAARNGPGFARVAGHAALTVVGCTVVARHPDEIGRGVVFDAGIEHTGYPTRVSPTVPAIGTGGRLGAARRRAVAILADAVVRTVLVLAAVDARGEAELLKRMRARAVAQILARA